MTGDNFTPPTSPKLQRIKCTTSNRTRPSLPSIFKKGVVTDIQRLKHVQNFEKGMNVKIKEYEARERMIKENEILLTEREKVLERKEKVLAAKDEMLTIKETRIIYDYQNNNAVANILKS
jgi:hypothetical protein